jgi:hypothetical protein|tara:strand:- start:2076 stop:2318 length:243 start_codon:yes stop_codon:yes gene_type:complete
MKEEVVIARIPRNVNEELVIRTAKTWNINIIDIRWYKNGNPTQKGVRINEGEFPLLMKALETITRRNKNDNINTGNESED